MLRNKEGEKVPEVVFKYRNNDEWCEISTDEIFKGKTVVLFALPGAFTPTCSSAHLPGYSQYAKVLKENGVDGIVCLSVNDTFVMNAWKEDQGADNISLIPDGNGEFTEKMGMLVDKDDLGFGKRTWRYSMLVKDKVIEKMFIEPEVEGDPFEASDAATMLNYINPEAKPMRVSLFTKKGCPFCAKTKALLRDNGLDYEEIQLGKTITTRSLQAVTNALTVPQVFINGALIGGFEELGKHLNKKEGVAV